VGRTSIGSAALLEQDDFNPIPQFELWARRITGAVFILVGIYLTLKYVFLVLG